jgi:hypothetical protein
VFVYDWPFQPSVMFVSITGAYLSVATFRLLASPSKIRLGWKSMLRTNTLA